MSYSFDAMKVADKVPHEKDYRTWTGRLMPWEKRG
jgi:hypothetical protein